MTETFKVGDKVTARGNDGTVTYGPFSSTFERSTMYVVKHADGKEKLYQETYLTPIPAFTVGDTVNTSAGVVGKLVAGPFDSSHSAGVFWVMERADGKHQTPLEYALTKVTPAAEPIKVGDRVRIVHAAYARSSHGKTGVVVSTSNTWEPSDGSGLHPYVVRVDGGGELEVRDVEKVTDDPADEIKVGDRVRVLEASGIPAAAGKTATVYTDTDQPGRLRVRLDEAWDSSGAHREIYADRWARVGGANTYTYTPNGVTYDLTARYVDREGDTFEFSSAECSGPHTRDGQNDGSPLGRCNDGEWVWSLAEAARRYGPLTRITD